ncbi:MAG: TonB-dependent receptor [Candidatus Paracaedibacteraceae bacterium]|nr:TonB-dependent receptor [Candidatus Paracaedibacteraceae bacterium]
MKPDPVVVRMISQTENSLFYRAVLLIFLITSAVATPTAPIVVTAKRYESLRPPPSAKITTFTQEKIKKNQYTQVIEVINATPGYMVVQSGGIGQQSSIFVRGTNSNHVQVRLDGMRINLPEASNGTVDAALLTTQNLNTVTLLRGGQSSLYGADAIGGVILLNTPKGTGNFEETVRLETGSQKTLSTYGHLAGGFKNSGIYIGLSRFTTGGISQMPLDYRQPTGHYPRLSYRQGSYAARFDHRFNETIDISLISRLSTANLSYQLQEKSVPQHRQHALQRFLWTIKPTSFWHHHLGFGYLTTDQSNARHDPVFTKTQGRRQQLDWTQTFETSTAGSVSITAETSKDAAHHHDTLVKASYSQAAHALGTLWQKKWSWIGFDISARHDKISRFHHGNTHREGIIFTPFKSTKFLVSHSTSFKTPTLYQLYAKTPYFTGNPKLKPEKAHQWEAGFEQRIGGQLLWEETYFINHLKGLIDATPDWKSVTNIGRARTSGLESILTWVGIKGWSADINHTYTKAKNLATNQRLLRRPLTKLSARLYYSHNDWLWTMEVSHTGRRQDVHPLTYQPIVAKPYMLVNFKTQKKFSDTFTLFGRIENLFNRKIQEPVGFRKAGISIFVGVEKTIGT